MQAIFASCLLRFLGRVAQPPLFRCQFLPPFYRILGDSIHLSRSFHLLRVRLSARPMIIWRSPYTRRERRLYKRATLTLPRCNWFAEPAHFRFIRCTRHNNYCCANDILPRALPSIPSPLPMLGWIPASFSLPPGPPVRCCSAARVCGFRSGCAKCRLWGSSITSASGGAGAHVRDVTAAADCSASVGANISTAGFVITATGDAATAVNNDLRAHWTANAEL